MNRLILKSEKKCTTDILSDGRKFGAGLGLDVGGSIKFS